MKFQCVLCLSTFKVNNLQLGASIDCPNCSKKIVVPKKSFDRGRVIGGDFVIDRILGTGGMGTVYLAHQISLERHVALKVLARKFSVDPKFRLEFQREARAASRLTHSNLVQAFAFGEDGGDLFLAMEYVEGVTLGDRLENETRLTVDEALNITQQVAEGLHFAWTQEQLIHRDIKPDNIMLTADGHVKLTDMGLARTAVELENVTEVSGTPAYMNPEQFTKQSMDCRADIYSLGVCLFHCLTGQIPFDSPNVRELARQHLQDNFEFPDKTLDLPSEVKKLLRKMMEKDRADRYKDHEDLLHNIHSTRLKINQSGAHVPSVHTLSFNRYEFKNMLPERKSNSNADIVGTKQLPRRKITPLSHVTSTLTGSFTATDRGSKGNLMTNNLVALLAVIAALILALFYGGDEKSQFYLQTQGLIAELENDSMKTEEILDRVDNLLASKPNSRLNKYDYQARSQLLDSKWRYLRQLLEEKEQALKKAGKHVQNARDNSGRLLAKLSKDLADDRSYIEELENLVDLARNTELLKSKGKGKSNPVNRSVDFSSMMLSDLGALEKLWKEKQKFYRLEILKQMSGARYSQARKYILDESENYSGKYKKWLKEDQYAFVGYARDVRDHVEVNLSSLVGETVIIKGDNFLVAKAYSGSMEIETEAGDSILLEEVSVSDFIILFDQICDLTGVEEVDKAAFAVAKLDFNYANELTADSKNVEEYAAVYVNDRLSYAEKLLVKAERDKAEAMIKKMYWKCNDLKSQSDLKSEIIKIFGSDTFLDESN